MKDKHSKLWEIFIVMNINGIRETQLNDLSFCFNSPEKSYWNLNLHDAGVYQMGVATWQQEEIGTKTCIKIEVCVKHCSERKNPDTNHSMQCDSICVILERAKLKWFKQGRPFSLCHDWMEIHVFNYAFTKL